MSSTTTPTKSAAKAAHAADELDERLHLAPGLRRQINKVFPTHWSFLLGEIALYTFIVLVISGIYLTFFYDPSMTEVEYQGVYDNMRGIDMSRAYETTLNISFAIRGGLFVRQIHHWAALVFTAAIMVHMFRIFFTGAFRKPRETNWAIGVTLLVLSMIEGFVGYSLPDDLLSGTGLRTGVSGIVLSIPVIGTWLHWMIFAGEFPGDIIIPRLYIVHVLLLPGILIALIGVHLALIWFQKHTQFPGPGRTENNVVGIRILPTFAVKSGGFTAVVVGVMALMGGIFQINPIWNYGPYVPAHDSAGSQPDWYMAIFDGAVRLWPSWEVYLFHRYTIAAPFFPAIIGMGIIFTLLAVYPTIERKFTRDNALHNLLQRPRDVPVRTSVGVMAIIFYFWLLLACGNDIFAETFNISLNAMIWIGRIGLILLPPIGYFVSYRICLGLQRADRSVLEHGIETGIIRRLPHGEFIEVHQPLGGVDRHGHPVELPYQGAPVPNKMNKLGSAGSPVTGSFIRPDPPEETAALERAAHADDRRELAGRPDAGRPKDVTS